EALLADVLAVEEGFQRLGIGEAREDAQLLLAREGRRVLRRLHALLQPPLDGRILAVHVLDADGAAVGPLEVREDLAKGHLALAGGEVTGGERLVQLLIGKAEVLDLQLGRRWLEQAERIEIREEVAADAVGVDELSDLLLEDLRLQPLLSGRGDGEELESGLGRKGDGRMAVAVAARGGRGRGLGPGARLECRRSGQAVQPREILLPLW